MGLFAGSPGSVFVKAVLAVLLLAFCVIAPVFPRIRWWPFALVIASATMAPQVSDNGVWGQPPALLAPLVQFGQEITAGLLAFSMLGYCFQWVRNGGFHVPRVSIAFFSIHLLLCVRQLLAGAWVEVSPRLAVYLVVFAFAGVLIPSLIDSVLAARRLAVALAIAGLLFLLGQLAVMALDYHAGFIQSRWFGLTANPNQAGMVVALILPATVGLAMLPSSPKIRRILALVMSSGLVIVLLLTGSRGAAATAVAALFLLFRRRLGQSILILLPLTLLVVALLAWSGFESAEFERMTSTQNTRIYVVEAMIDQWMKNPLFGSADRWGVSENAYLGVLVRTGIVGGIVLLVSGGVIVTQMLRVAYRQASLGPDGVLGDIAIAGIGAVMINSLFEATFFSNFNQTIFLVYAYLALLDACHRMSLPYGAQQPARGRLMPSYS